MDRILVIDDDEELCELVGEYLEAEGFSVQAAHRGDAGLQRAVQGGYAMVVLDVMLPGLGGFEVLRRVRAGKTPAAATPVLMLTARGDDVDRILGLELGADDYLPKPFNPRELTARIRAILRRTHSGPPERIVVEDVELDAGARTVYCCSEPLDLTTAEFDLLAVLLRSAGRVVSREQIAHEVFGRRVVPYDRSIDMHVSNLRRKLGAPGEGRERIKTVRNLGYIYAAASGRADR